MTKSGPARVQLSEECRGVIAQADDANRIHNKHYFGVPLPGGGLELSSLENVYLHEKGRVRVFFQERELGFQEIISFLKGRTGFDYQLYIAYRDLKSRGFIVKFTSPFAFSLYPGGAKISKTLSKVFADVFSERDRVDTSELRNRVKRAVDLRKDYMVQIIDEEGDVTYYRIGLMRPKGSAAPKVRDARIKGTLQGGRIVVFDTRDMDLLWVREFLGQRQLSTHQFSLVEGIHLMDRGVLELEDSDEKAPDIEALMELGREAEKNFDKRYELYCDLKKRGFIVKTGFKYGAHFRAYQSDPDREHADLLFHYIDGDAELTWSDVSRSVRVAHGVKKKMVFGFTLALPKEMDGNETEEGEGKGSDPKARDKLDYIMIKREKPYS